MPGRVWWFRLTIDYTVMRRMAGAYPCNQLHDYPEWPGNGMGILRMATRTARTSGRIELPAEPAEMPDVASADTTTDVSPDVTITPESPAIGVNADPDTECVRIGESSNDGAVSAPSAEPSGVIETDGIAVPTTLSQTDVDAMMHAAMQTAKRGVLATLVSAGMDMYTAHLSVYGIPPVPTALDFSIRRNDPMVVEYPSFHSVVNGHRLFTVEFMVPGMSDDSGVWVEPVTIATVAAMFAPESYSPVFYATVADCIRIVTGDKTVDPDPNHVSVPTVRKTHKSTNGDTGANKSAGRPIAELVLSPIDKPAECDGVTNPIVWHQMTTAYGTVAGVKQPYVRVTFPHLGIRHPGVWFTNRKSGDTIMRMYVANPSSADLPVECRATAPAPAETKSA